MSVLIPHTLNQFTTEIPMKYNNPEIHVTIEPKEGVHKAIVVEYGDDGSWYPTSISAEGVDPTEVFTKALNDLKLLQNGD